VRQSRIRPDLKALVTEATQALARLDPERLEELALSCQALNRDLAPVDVNERARLAREAREATAEMAVFARVLQATRANLHVMERLRNLRAGQPGYAGERDRRWTLTEGGHGNN
jgi:hypothetical protein